MAKKVLPDIRPGEDLIRIIESLSPELLAKMRESARTVEEYVRAPDLFEEDVVCIRKAIASIGLPAAE